MFPLSTSAVVATTLLSSLLLTQAKQAGNENYALEARRSLQAHRARSQIEKRSLGTSFDQESISFTFGNKTFLSPTGSVFKQHTLSPEWGLDDWSGQTLPVTVFEVQGEVTCDSLGDKVANFSSVDDVWDESFLSAIVLTTSSSFHVSSDVSSCLQGWGGSLIIKTGNATSDVSGVSVALAQSASIPQGPYIAKIGTNVTLTEVYRVYRDEAQAFTTAALHTSGDTFVDLTVPVLGLNTLSIPVPSRLYSYDLPDARPLEGKRVAIKDLFDIAGLKTGGGNRAYFNLYPAKEVSSVAVQKLVDQGAIIVGRAKTSQFANGESATADWVDQLCPFNPRGDGYQQPSSSSSGPGAAIGAYDWLDFTVGSDTGGSIIDPASVQGVFALRPTWGAISLTGVIPMQATQDTAGFFARDANEGSTFAKAWYGDEFKTYSSLPSTLILPNDTWTFDEGYAGADQFNTFRSALISYVNASNVSEATWDGLWNSTGTYETAGGQSADVYLQDIYANLITHYQWEHLGVSFFEDYAEVNDGRIPFLDPSPSVRWEYGRVNVTEEIFNASLAKKEVWKEFVEENVFVTDEETCSSSIMVYPYTLGDTAYRNIYKTGASVPLGWGYPAQMGGFPQMIVPVGQVPYESTISNHTEYLPITVTMMAAAGCDYVLWDLAAGLQNAGIISSVAAGPLAYPDRV